MEAREAQDGPDGEEADDQLHRSADTLRPHTALHKTHSMHYLDAFTCKFQTLANNSFSGL